MKNFLNLLKSNFGFVILGALLLFASVVTLFVMPALGAILLVITLAYAIIASAVILRRGNNSPDSEDSARPSKLISPAIYIASTPFAIISNDNRVVWRNKAFNDIFNVSVGASVASQNNSDPSSTATAFPSIALTPRTLSDVSLSFDRLKTESFFSIDFKVKQYRVYSTPCGINSRYRAVLFSDITDIKELKQEREDSSTLVAFIQIDNAAEIRESHSQFAQTSAKIEVFLREWVKNLDGFITKDENDMFILLFEKRFLKNIIDSRFEVLDDIVNLSVDEELPLTISIGISSPNGTLQQKYDDAKKSLNKAYESGGAKAVIASGDGIYAEYGGKHKPFQSQSATRARICKEKLKNAICSSDNVLIFGHKRPDIDSIASCLGLAKFVQLVSKGSKKVKIVIDENEVSIKRLIKYLYEEIGKGAKEFENLFIDVSTAQEKNSDGTLLLISDVSNPYIFESSTLYEMVNTVFVIDHHSLTGELNVFYKYIDPSASSASELISEICELELGQMQLGAPLATMLLSGILLDTNIFKRDTGPRTFAACRYLCKEGADFKTASYLLANDDEKLEQYKTFVTSDDGVYVCLIDKEYEPDNKILASKVSDYLVSLPDHIAVFTLYKDADGISLSARSDSSYSVKSVALTLGGGGHYQAAGASLKTKDESGNEYMVTDIEEAKKMVFEAVDIFKKNGHQYLENQDDEV